LISNTGYNLPATAGGPAASVNYKGHSTDGCPQEWPDYPRHSPGSPAVVPASVDVAPHHWCLSAPAAGPDPKLCATAFRRLCPWRKGSRCLIRLATL